MAWKVQADAMKMHSLLQLFTTPMVELPSADARLINMMKEKAIKDWLQGMDDQLPRRKEGRRKVLLSTVKEVASTASKDGRKDLASELEGVLVCCPWLEHQFSPEAFSTQRSVHLAY